jgi:hypothetical protein
LVFDLTPDLPDLKVRAERLAAEQVDAE